VTDPKDTPTNTAESVTEPPPANGPAAVSTNTDGDQLTLGDTPPAKRGPGRPRKDDTSPRKSRGPGKPSNKAKRTEAVAGQLTAIGMSLAGVAMVTGQPTLAADGESFATHADPIAESLAELAETNPRVARFIDTGVTGSAWLAVGALGRDLATNHGVIGSPATVDAPPAEPGSTSGPFAGLASVLDQS